MIACLLLISITGFAQTQRGLVEHFTNTRCSICASNNPSFYTLFDSYEDSNLTHISFHPSSPYSNCAINNLNTSENDNHTKSYGLYGSTPRFVVNGKIINGPVRKADLDASFGKKAIAVLETQSDYKNDSLKVKVSIKNNGNNRTDTLKGYMAIVQKVYDYNAPNGEKTHRDVFLRWIFNGDMVKLSGDNTKSSFDSTYTWTGTKLNNTDKLYIYSWITLMNKTVIQVTETKLNASVSSIEETKIERISSYPNPTNHTLNFEGLDNTLLKSYKVINIMGVTVLESSLKGNTQIDVNSLSTGLYQVIIQDNLSGRVYSTSFIKE